MARLVAGICALALVAVACDASTPASTSTSALDPVEATTPSPTTTSTEPDLCPDAFCLVYHIRQEATWSDGVPVSSEDLVYTFEANTDPVIGRVGAGYEKITAVTALDEKTALVVFSEPFGPWRTLFDPILPAHVMAEGLVPELAYRTGAGPFLLESWDEGDRVVLRRNPAYWAAEDPLSGSPLGDIETLEYLFSMSVRDSLAGLAGGEVHYLNTRPLDWMVAEVIGTEGIVYELGAGPFWEHIDFNHDDPLLSRPWVREVIDMAIDRGALLDATVRTVLTDASGLDNTLWMSDSTWYESHYADRHDPERAEQVMIDNGCERGDDGVYVCEGIRMSFRWATTTGDEQRETLFDLAESQLEVIGIELVPVFMTPSQLFSQPVFFGGPEVWQIMNFSWKAGSDPYQANGIYQCSGPAPSGFGALNVNRYCDEEVDELLGKADVEPDYEARAALYNQVDEIYLSDLALIPLYQKPAFAVWRAEVTGPTLNMSDSTDMWNIATWRGVERLVVALGNEPGLPSPLHPLDEDVALVLAPVLTGAFGVTPNLEYVPVLVESVEVLAGGG